MTGSLSSTYLKTQDLIESSLSAVRKMTEKTKISRDFSKTSTLLLKTKFHQVNKTLILKVKKPYSKAKEQMKITDKVEQMQEQIRLIIEWYNSNNSLKHHKCK